MHIIEPAITAEIAKEVGVSFNPNRFIPYILLYEIESLLFAGPYEMEFILEQTDLEPRFSTNRLSMRRLRTYQ